MNETASDKSIEVKTNKWDINLDYSSKNSFTSIFKAEGNIHPYPAKTVPDMVHDLLNKLKEEYNIKSVLDPFVGSGTVALESRILGLDFYGCDLNPLAVLLARTKSLMIKDFTYIKQMFDDFVYIISKEGIYSKSFPIEHFKNIDYWFKNENIFQLSCIKYYVSKFLDEIPNNYKEPFSLIILTAFSMTIRESSLTRSEEFKLYRLPPSQIAEFNVNSLNTFIKHINELLNIIQHINEVYQGETTCEIFLKNAKDLSCFEKVDLIFTSPPYGDSKSTVSYGQFSRLSLQWMSDLIKKYLQINISSEDCDEFLLGGKYSGCPFTEDYCDSIIKHSETLTKLISDIKEQTKKELSDFEYCKNYLSSIEREIFKEQNINNNILFQNNVISDLIKEKVRLYIYRKVNSKSEVTRKQVKNIVICETERFFIDIMGTDIRKKNKRIALIRVIYPYVVQAVNRKIKNLTKREKEIKSFFIDLFDVIKQTDNIIEKNGLQVWVVGHRTVLGNLEIKLADILLEWFESINYTELALITRNYHYKRLPHHINSTITRNKEVRTMMQEYILIVKKNNSTE